MDVTVLRDSLVEALKIVTQAVEKHPHLPILNNVLLQTNAAQLILVGTDLEVTIRYDLGARVDEPGAITLPAWTLLELINSAPPESSVRFQLDEATAVVTMTTTKVGKRKPEIDNLKGIPATEFPGYANDIQTVEVELVTKDFLAALERVIFVPAKNENRPVLCGVYFGFDDDGTLRLAGADGYSLAECLTRYERKIRTLGTPPPRHFILPKRSASRLFDMTADQMTLRVGEERVIFECGRVTVASMLISGMYPQYRALFPTQENTKAEVYRADLIAACKRSEIFSHFDLHEARFNLKPSDMPTRAPGLLTVFGRGAERGDAEISVDSDIEGAPLEVKCNVTRLLQALNVMPNEKVILGFQQARDPITVRAFDNSDYLFMMMPLVTP